MATLKSVQSITLHNEYSEKINMELDRLDKGGIDVIEITLASKTRVRQMSLTIHEANTLAAQLKEMVNDYVKENRREE